MYQGEWTQNNLEKILKLHGLNHKCVNELVYLSGGNNRNMDIALRAIKEDGLDEVKNTVTGIERWDNRAHFTRQKIWKD